MYLFQSVNIQMLHGLLHVLFIFKQRVKQIKLSPGSMMIFKKIPSRGEVLQTSVTRGCSNYQKVSALPYIYIYISGISYLLICVTEIICTELVYIR